MLRLVHDLQPLNAVTIRDSSVSPFIEHLAESFSGYTVYGMMDLFTGYDQRPLHVDSRDMTMFNSPLGPHCLTTLPMGHTDAVQIYQADMAFIPQDEIPHHTMPFINDLPVKSETSWCKDNRTAGRTKGVRYTCPGPSKGRGKARYFAPKGTQGKGGVGRKSKAEGLSAEDSPGSDQGARPEV